MDVQTLIFADQSKTNRGIIILKKFMMKANNDFKMSSLLKSFWFNWEKLKCIWKSKICSMKKLGMIYSLKSKWSLILIVLMSKLMTRNNQKSPNKYLVLMKMGQEIKIWMIFLKVNLIHPNLSFLKRSHLLSN